MKISYLDHAQETFVSREHSYNDGIEIKHLGLTCDDYIEERVPAYSLDNSAYNNISSIDLTKLNNYVSTYTTSTSTCLITVSKDGYL